jgi:lipopolysaccharide biosynthesis glycosyltransferase
MHIVSAADERFAPHFCAMLHSAWLFHPKASYTLLAHEVSGDTLARLREFAGKRDIALDIVTIGSRLTDGLPLGNGNSAATYDRLFLADLLPVSVERAIYLDADITLNGGLDDLFSMDMRGMPLAAAPDNESGRAIELSVRDLPDDFRYFNAGVFLADLAMWRRERIADQMVSFARSTTAPLILMDQSLINIVLQRRILPLDRALNTYDIRQFEDVSDPIVIHHCGRWKPWRAPWSAFHDLYRFHRSQTPWPLQDSISARQRFKDWRRRMAALLGIPWYRDLAEEIRAHEDVRRTVAQPALKRARGLLAARQTAG